MNKSKWYSLSLIIVLLIIISPAINRLSFAQEEPWRIPIEATGQGGYGSTIYIGMDTNAVFPLPPSSPSTVSITLEGDLSEDIRDLGTGRQVWYLKVKIFSSADPNLQGYYPELSWDPNHEMADLHDLMELRRGLNEEGDLLADMITTKTYETQKADGYYDSSRDMTILNYTVIYDPNVCTIYYQDLDGDTYGDSNYPIGKLSQSSGYAGYSEIAGDCVDTDPNSYPGALEMCDGKDNDCDGIIPEDEIDGDNDGVPGCADCDDSDPNCYPGALELCDGKDNDCDGETDEGINTYYLDSDDDGYGDPNISVNDTSQHPHYVTNNTDCDDTNADINPGIQESSNDLDDNCNAIIDEIPPTISSNPPLSNKVGVEYIYSPTASGHPTIRWSFEVSPDTMTIIDPNTGKITWIPDPNQVGDHSITLKAENVIGFDDQTWTISVNPAITSTPSQLAKVVEEYSYAPIAIGKGGTDWFLTESPEGMSIDDTSGEITWVPDEGQIQDHAVTLQVTVNEKDDIQHWTITVTGSSSEQSGEGGGGGCFLSLFLQSLQSYLSQLL